jgi:hypothetical protein
MRRWHKRTSFYEEHEDWVLAALLVVFLGGSLTLIMWLGGKP